MSDGSTATPTCANCTRTECGPGINLKRCAKCKSVRYCSRECQKEDWKVHKKACAVNSRASDATSSSTTSTPTDPHGNPTRSKGLAVTIDKPFHQLDSRSWLHNRPEQDVYKLLIDTYRFRMEDNYVMDGDADLDSPYGGARDGSLGFRRFLRLVTKRKGLLPTWWTAEKAAECERMGRLPGWSSLASVIEKSDVMEEYGDGLMPMQLRMFGEQVYGRGPGGQSGAQMREVQMMVEKKMLQSKAVDVSSVFR